MEKKLATLCAPCCNKCPEVFLDEGAPEDKQIRITDDFGQEIHMSQAQFQTFKELAQSDQI